ncbi:MAG TPA: hypothetical protein VGM92_01845, partial [Candidatus Kapabacteria bacterium]
MKKLLFFSVFMLLTAVSFAQTMRMTPDSGAQGSQLAVTIVGTGTHFSSSNNASMIAVALLKSGQTYASAYGSLVNDSTVTVSISVSNSMQIGTYYDLLVQVTDTGVHTFSQSAAFLVTAPPPSIRSVSPSSAYDSQIVTVTIAGVSTNFLQGPTPEVSFFRNGVTDFYGTVDSVISATSIQASVTVPANAASGSYSVVVSNSQYSDTGKSLFTALGQAPTTQHVPMQMIPDSGYPGEGLSVTIVGNGTHFNATTNASVNITLEQEDTAVYTGTGFITNDSTISMSFVVRSSFPLNNYYDLYIELADDNGVDRTFIRDSAFHIVPAPPSIVSVNPSSAYDSQTV